MSSLYRHIDPWLQSKNLASQIAPALDRPVILVSAITIVGAVLRFYGIGDNSLWFDEGFSVSVASSSLPELVQKTLAADTHPPTYYLLLHFWIGLFGSTEAGIRSLSALVGSATVVLVYRAGRIIGGPRMGLVAAFLFGVSPVDIQYSQEARMYPLLVFAAGLGFWGAARFICDMYDRAGLRRATMLLSAGGVLALASHNTGGILVATLSATIAAAWMLEGRPRSAPFYWLVFNLAVALPLGAWLPFLIRQAHTAMLATAWISPIDLNDIAIQIGPLFAQRIPSAAAGIAVLLVAGIGVSACRRNRKSLLLCVLGIAIPIALTLAISVAVKPILITKVLLWLLIPLYLLLAAAVIDGPSISARSLAVGVLVVVMTLGLRNYFSFQSNENWRAAVMAITSDLDERDLVVAAPSVDDIVGYYSARLPERIMHLDGEDALDRLTRQAGDNRVWQIATSYHDALDSSSIANALAQTHTMVRKISLMHVSVSLWRPTPAMP
jgi:uncharacterized membrane protein